MRYLPNRNGHGGFAFNAGRRPPLEALDPTLSERLIERDRIREQLGVARVKVADLGTDQATRDATQADDIAATKAARAGKAIPAAVATGKLQTARETAAREFAAQESAAVILDAEVETLASDLYWARLEQRNTERAETRETIRAQAEQLADAVQHAIDQHAVDTWYRTGNYDVSMQTWPSEIVPLANEGLDRKNLPPCDVRTAIVAAALAVLEDDN